MVDERRGEGDAALAVELALEGSTEDEALEGAALARERVEPLGLRRHVVVPGSAGPDRDAVVEPLRTDQTVLELDAQPRRQRNPVLVIQPLLELAEEHCAPLPGTTVPLDSISRHFTPPCPTM